MRIKFDRKKNIKKISMEEIEKKKLNSIQLNEWGLLCNFASPTHLWCWGERKEEGIIARAPPCHRGQHVSTHCVKGGMML